MDVKQQTLDFFKTQNQIRAALEIGFAPNKHGNIAQNFVAARANFDQTLLMLLRCPVGRIQFQENICDCNLSSLRALKKVPVDCRRQLYLTILGADFVYGGPH